MRYIIPLFLLNDSFSGRQGNGRDGPFFVYSFASIGVFSSAYIQNEISPCIEVFLPSTVFSIERHCPQARLNIPETYSQFQLSQQSTEDRG